MRPVHTKLLSSNISRRWVKLPTLLLVAVASGCSTVDTPTTTAEVRHCAMEADTGTRFSRMKCSEREADAGGMSLGLAQSLRNTNHAKPNPNEIIR